MYKKRLVAAALCLVLATGVFSGCSRQEQEETPQDVQRGKYVAAEETLSEQGEEWTIKQIFTVEGKLHLLMAVQEGEITVLREWEQQGEEFTDVSRAWLTSLELPCKTWADMHLMREESGTQYLFVRLVNEEGFYEGCLWREDGDEAVEITPEKWTVPDETWGAYENIQGIETLNNGTLLAVSPTSVDMINGEDGRLLESEQVMGEYGEIVLSDGDNIYIATLGSAGDIAGLEKRPGGNRENAEQISLPISGMSGIYLCVGEDGALVAAGADGIFRYNMISGDWEKLLEGTETDFALTTCWCIGLAALEDGSVSAVFQQEDGTTRLLRYVYDPDAVTEVTENLKLYTVWENSLLQQAATMYHREHPEVLVTVEYVYSISDRYSGEAPDYEQVYQSFNTMLMGDEAPDILVMDHLDMDSYAEKGLLVDIDDIVAPMEQAGELFSSITGAYVKEDGSRYAVPLQFGFMMAIGRDIGASDMESLESLADFLGSQTDSYMGGLTADELVDQFYPYFCQEIVKDKELDREALSKILENLKKIAGNSGIVSSREKDEHRYNVWDLASRAKFAFEECRGFYDSMFPIAIMEYVKGDFTAYESCFIPSMQTGISVKSKYQETARDFLRFALSEEVQSSVSYGDFPVNQAAFERQASTDRSDVAAVTTIETEDGGQEMFEILPYSQEITERIADLCRKLDRPVVEDAKIREELIAALPWYLDGSRTLEETLDSIEGGLRMYLAE